MKNLLKVACACISLVIQSQEVEEAQFKEPLQQGLIVLLDRNNSEFLHAPKGAITQTLSNALKSGIPILLSRSLLANEKRRSDQPSSFNEQEHITKEIDDFYLILPKKEYVNLITQFSSENLSDITPTEEYHTIKQPITKTFLKLLPPASKSNTSWTILLMGHGTYGTADKPSAIADFTIPEFQDFLSFLQHRINTKLLIYDSCYAGGINKAKAFQEQEKNIISQKTYTFPIIIEGIADTPNPSFKRDFQKLFDQLLQETYNLPNYFSILFNSITGTSELTPYAVNFPQIRLPGTTWFSTQNLNVTPQEENKDFTIISSVRGLTRTKPLNAPRTSQALFVYTPSIPFKIDLDSETTPFVFMAQNTNIYHFAEIYAPKITLQQLVNAFNTINYQSNNSYTIYIDTLTYLEDKHIETLKNCIIYLHPYSPFESVDEFIKSIFPNRPRPIYKTTFFGTRENRKRIQLIEYKSSYDRFQSFFVDPLGTIQEITYDYTKNFPPAPPFEQLSDLEKSIKEKTQAIALATRAFGKPSKNVGLKQLLEKK